MTPQRDPPTVSGYYPVYTGNSPSPVVGYFNSRDARWYVLGLRYTGPLVWLGPEPLPERRVRE